MISILYLALVRVLPVISKYVDFSIPVYCIDNKPTTYSKQLVGSLNAVVQGYTRFLDDANQATAAGAFNFVKNL